MKKDFLPNRGRHLAEWLHHMPRSADSLRRLGLLLLLLPILWLVLMNVQAFDSGVQVEPNPVMTAVLDGFEDRTGARNAVAAIYLNYRLFDTLLETLLLAVSVTGIVYFLEEKGREGTDKPT